MPTPPSDKTPQPWLGAVQAAGFVAGGILGYAFGKALGMDPMDPAGYTTSAMVGILLVVAGIKLLGLHPAKKTDPNEADTLPPYPNEKQ